MVGLIVDMVAKLNGTCFVAFKATWVIKKIFDCCGALQFSVHCKLQEVLILSTLRM